IDPSQADLLKRLVSEVGALTRGRQPHRPGIIVRTAVPLAPAERTELEQVLARRFGTGQPVTFAVDPTVLGGVWLRVGDRIIDGSLRGRLEALRKQLT
ncbi:MAG TPA: F0F1 ATP synthase subunit delta, partial [Anaerolineae bacterium]|nr:F0F1 ATP synthase subunit delta [Anaerolineae bacterium]